MKNILLGLLLTSGFLYAQPAHSPELAAPLNALYQMTETKQILESVETEGALNLQAIYSGWPAAWYPEERTIRINCSKDHSYGSVIRSLIFELHNVMDQKQFEFVDELAIQQKLSKDEYVRKIEQMEYQSALKTLEIVKRGVSQGIFPADAAEWPVAPSFIEHMRMQYESGHAQAVALLYDQLRSLPLYHHGSL